MDNSQDQLLWNSQHKTTQLQVHIDKLLPLITILLPPLPLSSSLSCLSLALPFRPFFFLYKLPSILSFIPLVPLPFYLYLYLHLSILSFFFSLVLLIFHPLAPDDYTSISSSPITFPSGSAIGNRLCVNISITDDSRFEADTERFSISLTTTDSSVTVVPDSGEVEIRDNESK